MARRRVLGTRCTDAVGEKVGAHYSICLRLCLCLEHFVFSFKTYSLPLFYSSTLLYVYQILPPDTRISLHDQVSFTRPSTWPQQIWSSSSIWDSRKNVLSLRFRGQVAVSVSLGSLVKKGWWLTVHPVQGALEWLETNQDKSIEDIKAASTEEQGPALNPGEMARSLVCNECGKKFRSTAQAEFHASKTEHQDFSESTDEIAPLTEEEKAAKLAELREKMKAKREGMSEQDKIDKKRNEEIRKKSTKETQDIKEELAKKEQIKEAAKKRQEKLADVEAKKRIQAKIAADKEERRLKNEREKAEREGRATPAEPIATAPTTNPGPATSKPASAYTETRLRLQTPNGNVMKAFPVETTLFEVAAELSKDSGMEVESFTQTFPTKVFNNEFFGETLKELKLVPSASLIVK
jgi:UBX domain-containing protein 1/4